MVIHISLSDDAVMLEIGYPSLTTLRALNLNLLLHLEILPGNYKNAPVSSSDQKVPIFQIADRSDTIADHLLKRTYSRKSSGIELYFHEVSTP